MAMPPAPLWIGFKLYFLAFGLMFIDAALVNRHRNIAAANWPTVEGEVVDFRMIKVEDRDQLHIEYRFIVDGREFTSGRVAFYSVDLGQRLHTSYRAGEKVRVYYDPRNPGKAVLECEPSQQWLILFVFGIVLTTLVLFWLLVL